MFTLHPTALTFAIMNLWHALPLIVSVSLVYAATRQELMEPILRHATRFAVWVIVFMGVLVGLMSLLQYLE